MSKIRYIEAFGEIKSIKDWYNDPRLVDGLSYGGFLSRIYRNTNPEIAITKNTRCVTNHTYKHDYFKTLNLKNAWIIGFITADGHVRKDGSQLMFGISYKDISILEHIRNEISPDSKIKIKSVINKSGVNNKICTLQISSTQIVKDLLKYNIISQKTGNEKLPKFPNKKVAYRYLLGIFDGDGSVGLYRLRGYKCFNRSFSISCASKTFLESIQRYFKLYNNKVRVVSYNKLNQPSCYELRVCNKSQLLSLYKNLYNQKGFYLKRKKDKFKKVIASINNRGSA